MVNPTTPLITELPITAAARERFLEHLFSDELPHWGELFVPGDDFYTTGPLQQRAETMLRQLCIWLGVKPGYFAVELEDMPASTQTSRYRIYVERFAQTDEFILGAVLAQALTRYWLEDRKQVRLPEPDQQAGLRATASIEFGLGIVISNGLVPRYRRQVQRQLLADMPRGQYTSLVTGFLRRYRVPAAAYQRSLAPWVARWLHVHSRARPVHAVRAAQHHLWVRRGKQIGLAWLVAIVLLLVIFTVAHRVRPQNPRVQTAQNQVQLLHNLLQLCRDSTAYDQRYSDQSDIQVVRSLNAEQNRCNSLQNQYQDSVTTLENLSGR